MLTARRKARSGTPAKVIDFVRFFGLLKVGDGAFADKQKIAQGL
jgi:hypothetical protein